MNSLSLKKLSEENFNLRADTAILYICCKNGSVLFVDVIKPLYYIRNDSEGRIDVVYQSI